MMVHQVALTVVAAIKPGEKEVLNGLFTSMGAGSSRYGLIPFDAMSATHFARLVIIDGEGDTGSLLLTLDCDAPLDQRMEELVRVAGPGLHEVFRHCEGYPHTERPSADQQLSYLQSRMVDVEVFYVHTVGRTLQQIQQEEQLRLAIEGFLDNAEQTFRDQGPVAVRDSIRKFVWSEPTLAWARTPAPRPELWFRVREAVHQYGTLVVLFFLLGFLVPAAMVWVTLLRFHELTDPPPSVNLDRDRLRDLSDAEDYIVQNAISTLADIKPGRFWRLTATIFLGVANYSSRHIFNQGSLSGLTTVHFARFMKLDNGRKVLFTSYYDGSLESYMNDFIDQVSWVLNAVFGNESGYPKTRWLFFDGATNELGFKTFLRGHQIPTQVWYSAYERLAAVNIDNNAQIREGLYGDMSPAQAEEWLRRL